METPVDRPATTERRDDNVNGAPSHDTGEHPVTKREMRTAFRINEIWTFLVACAVAIGAVFGLYRYAISEARAAGAEPAAAAERKADNNAAAMARMQTEFTEHVQVESAARVRMEKKLNALLDRLDVKDPAPTPKDGGQ